MPFATAEELAIADVGGGSGEPGHAVAAHPVYLVSPMSNGVGDGEANVPFTSLPASAEEIGGGSGEPGHVGAGAMDAAARAEADREFERQVWTAP